MRAKLVYEAFKEKSNPIEDLGIGLRGVYNNIKRDDIVRIHTDLPMQIFGRKDPFIYPAGSILVIHNVLKHKNDDDIVVEYTQYKNTKDYQNDKAMEDEDGVEKRRRMWTWDYKFFKKYFEVIVSKR